MVAIQSYYPDLNADLAVDSVQEFKVQSGPMSAEYGLTAGGVINVATKSGTNSYHGSLYEFVRNDAFDARNTFATTVAPFRYNQYGLALGGPVRIPKLYDGRNKTFIFGNWEEWRYSKASFPITTVPTEAFRNGDFSQLRDANGNLIPVYDPATTVANPNGSGFIRSVFPGNIIPPNRLDPVAKAANAFYPLPNRIPSNPYTIANNYIGDVKNVRSMQQYTIRGDHHISDSDSLFARYTYFNHRTTMGRSRPGPTRSCVHETTASRQETRFFRKLTYSRRRSSMRFARSGSSVLPIPGRELWRRLAAKTGITGQRSSDSYAQFQQWTDGFPTQTVGLRGALTWQFSDTVTIVKGSHSIKSGFEYRLLYGNNYQTSAPSGSFTFVQGLTGNPQAQSGTGSSFATLCSARSAVLPHQPTPVNPSRDMPLQDSFRMTGKRTGA